MLEKAVFFDGWNGVARVVVLAVLGYAILLLMLRLARKRSLAQMNTFDFINVVVMGELLAIMILDDRVSLVEGVAGVAVMVALQLFISWITTRSRTVARAINGEPTLLMRRGHFLRDALKAQRLTEAEILSIVREHGVADLECVEAVVLETNGALSVVHFGTPSRAPALRDVPGMEADDDHAEPTPAPRERRFDPRLARLRRVRRTG